MKKNTPNILKLSCLAILLLCSILLVGCKVVLPNSYFKAREKTQKILAHNGFKGKVQVKLIKKGVSRFRWYLCRLYLFRGHLR